MKRLIWTSLTLPVFDPLRAALAPCLSLPGPLPWMAVRPARREATR